MAEWSQFLPILRLELKFTSNLTQSDNFALGKKTYTIQEERI